MASTSSQLATLEPCIMYIVKKGRQLKCLHSTVTNCGHPVLCGDHTAFSNLLRGEFALGCLPDRVQA